MIVLFNSMSNGKCYTVWIKEDCSSHIPFPKVEINLKKDGFALQKSTIVTPVEQNSREHVDVQVSNEQVDDVSDEDDDDAETGDFENTHIQSTAHLCQKELGNKEAEGEESGHSQCSLVWYLEWRIHWALKLLWKILENKIVP
ncbi:hypothetical protein RHGRI_038049 [Rhododendron griersonianum]|uniref:Uncharacterized protein n=1 Tax=Rhododendron griersonianum TaxID=479676 RepID=A0AAV6HY32_9ERIC|nr:hypothetical protein RHGRI_038049 [Rhododendron griersonianum]